MLISILINKMVDFCVKKFYLMRKVLLERFLTLKLHKNIFKLRKIYSFGFSYFFFKAIDEFIKVSKMFSKCV